MGYIIAIALAIFVAFLICHSLKADMSNVAIKTEASDFVEKQQVSIEIRTDQFTHQTVSRRKIEKNNN